MKMTWFSLILLLSFTINSISEASHGRKLRSAVVSGTVYCASVAVFPPPLEDSMESNTKSTMEFGQPNYPVFPPPLEDPAPPQPTPLLPSLPPLPQLPPLPPLPLPPFPPIPGRN
ncbi:hypothetical protein HRI_000573300 [Hibiscus trionum]|uniref:Uncharacterized protein n=1 Tax=Hibiscus trionum TaxID=183268 RepID=A0A9W7H436_HIBTR|nr:hypothetical protein HRI_000573300 [Hibiscus trionum]